MSAWGNPVSEEREAKERPLSPPPIPPKGPQGKPTQALATSSWALTCCRKKPEEAGRPGERLGYS